MTGIRKVGKNATTLEGLYQKNFERVLQEKWSNDSEFYQRAISPLVCARKPLEYRIWMEICGYSTEKAKAFEDEVLSTLQEMLYIPHDGSVKRVRFLHKSTSSFLLSPSRCKTVRANPFKGHNLLAEW